MNRVDAYRMVRGRTADAGFRVKLGCHVFRATGITADLEAGGTLENAPIGDAVRLGSDPNSWNPVKRAETSVPRRSWRGTRQRLANFLARHPGKSGSHET